MDIDDLAHRFGFHPEEKQASHGSVRDACLQAAIRINMFAPDSREKSLAITHLENAMFWASAAIARNT